MMSLYTGYFRSESLDIHRRLIASSSQPCKSPQYCGSLRHRACRIVWLSWYLCFHCKSLWVFYVRMMVCSSLTEWVIKPAWVGIVCVGCHHHIHRACKRRAYTLLPTPPTPVSGSTSHFTSYRTRTCSKFPGRRFSLHLPPMRHSQLPRCCQWHGICT